MELSNLPGEEPARITIRKDVTTELKKQPYELRFPCPKCFSDVILKFNGGELDTTRHPECKLTFSLEMTRLDLIVTGEG